jgi:hypothetical protein
VSIDDESDDAQAEPTATARASQPIVDLIELAKDFPDLVRRNSDTVVLDFEADASV